MTTKHIPKVSIGMPVYNEAMYIRKALDSLLAQTFIDFELIISDNASTDATDDICREYAACDPRIRYVRQSENRGGLANFRIVFDEAVGQYFMWAAADDMRDQNYIMKCLTVFSMDPDVALVFSNYGTYYHASERVKYKQLVSPCLSNNKCIRLMQRMLDPCPSMFYGLFRKSILKGIALKYFDWFDVYLTNYIALKGKLVVLSDYLYCSGIKEADGVRIVKCAKDGKLSIRNYSFHMLRLILKECPIIYIAPLFIILLWQLFVFKRAARAGRS